MFTTQNRKKVKQKLHLGAQQTSKKKTKTKNTKK